VARDGGATTVAAPGAVRAVARGGGGTGAALGGGLASVPKIELGFKVLGVGFIVNDVEEVSYGRRPGGGWGRRGRTEASEKKLMDAREEEVGSHVTC
jgi:hypothetical protein